MPSRIRLCLALVLSFALGTGFERARAALQHDDEWRVTGIGGVFFKARDPEALAAWYNEHLGIALESAGGGYYPFGVSDLFLDDTRGLENFGGCSSAYS